MGKADFIAATAAAAASIISAIFWILLVRRISRKMDREYEEFKRRLDNYASGSGRQQDDL